ncbi:hypothetical protein S250808_089 [Synechococcus phage S-CAM3]|uniref:Uncharacterized protein n=1 Tax=Synechococcus phage S-CAM3 TaxID=1883366 RepID=A0A1D8KJ11_9CAUD|nr:hypothetical protein S250808_089 [Synechococcus phage S-CAM3]
MTLRNVPNSYTLEQQRQEINTIAVDLDTVVDGVQTFTGDKTFSNNVSFSDSVVANFGDDADLKLYYDATVGIETSFIDSDALQIRSSTDISDLYATFLKDGPVELYYDGSKKFGTSATGASVIGTFTADGVEIGGDISINDSDKILFGADNDMSLYHSGVHGFLENGTGNLYLRSSAGTSIHIEPAAGADSIVANAGGSVQLHYNGSEKLETVNTGVTISGDILHNATNYTIFDNGNALFEDVEATSLHMKDDRPAHFGTNEDASLYYDNTSSDLRLDSEVGFHVRWYDTVNTQYEDQVVFSPFGGTSVYYQGAANPTVDVTNEVRIRGDVEIGDITNGSNLELHAGNNNKFKIFASSNEAYIRNTDNNGGTGGGGLNIAARTTLGLYSGGTGGSYITFVGDSDGAANLYHQTLLKLKTAADGVDITGTLDVSGNTTIGAPDVTNASTGGVEAFSSGQLRIQRDGSGDATDKRFQMYYGTSETASITAGGDATFAGNLTLSDDTKELTAQIIRPTTTGTSMRIGVSGNSIIVDSDTTLFQKVAFFPGTNYGLELGAFGTGTLSSTSVATGTNKFFRRYEEGTWTGTVSSTNANLSAATFVEGYYTRIGQFVYIEGEVSYTNTGNNSELGFTITPPFDMATDEDKGSVFCGSSYWSASRGFGGVVDNTSANDNEIFVMLHQSQNDTGTTGICRFSLSYHAVP